MSRWDTTDTCQGARLHLLRVMQAQGFSVELNYLKNPSGQVPVLVSDLNLFVDDSGLLRSAGRTGKVSSFDYDIVNPILLVKDHPLTSLILNDAHERVQHCYQSGESQNGWFLDSKRETGS